MNIFYLDADPKLCAQYHCDKHVIKMIVETAQLLCSAHWASHSSAPYKKTHINHPCSKWVRESIFHYHWLCKLGLELCKEYTFRYNKIHKTEKVIEWLIMNCPNLPYSKFKEPPLAMPNYCKIGDTIQSYRNYYMKEKNHFITYKKRNKPKWLKLVQRKAKIKTIY